MTGSAQRPPAVESARRQPQPGRGEETPELSVVITTHNRADLLELCLGSLARQDVDPERYEVVVVSDGSSDRTAALVRELALPCALSFVEQPPSGSARGRNLGAAHARGRILLFMDDDELAHPGLVSAHLGAHRAQEQVVVIGAIQRRIPGRADRFMRLSATSAKAHLVEMKRRPARFWDCYGGNFSVTRAAFETTGGFAVELPRENDTELAYRLGEHGLEFVFAPEAIVSEYRARDWRGIVAEGELRGRLAVDLYRRHPGMLPAMPLGGYGELGRPRLRQAIERALLALRLPPRLLGRVVLVLPPRAFEAGAALTMRHAYWTGVRAAASPELWRRARSGVLILGYHAFGAEGEKASRYVVPGRRFAAQLAWLKRRGYTVITLGAYADLRRSHRLPPRRTVVLTIDDGYRDVATVARPHLEAAGFPATVFLLSSPRSLDGRRDDPALEARELIDPTQADALLGPRFEFGSHSRSHRDLTTIGSQAAAAEISGSKRDLESALSRPVGLFAYPYGAVDQQVRNLVEQAGFVAARGIRPGRNRAATDAYDLNWLEVRGTYSLARFAAMLVVGELPRLPRLRLRHAPRLARRSPQVSSD